MYVRVRLLSLRCNTVRKQLSKESLPESVNLSFCGSSCPPISYWPLKVSVQPSHSPSTLLPSEKGCPTHPPTKPQGGQSTPLPLLGCGRDPSCTLPPGGAAWFQPTCRPLFPPLQRDCLSPKIISRVKKTSRKVPSTFSHGSGYHHSALHGSAVNSLYKA